jgi:hypothetical protein
MEKMMAVGISAMWPNFHSIVCGLRSELNMSSSPPTDASEWYLEERSTKLEKNIFRAVALVIIVWEKETGQPNVCDHMLSIIIERCLMESGRGQRRYVAQHNVRTAAFASLRGRGVRWK